MVIMDVFYGGRCVVRSFKRKKKAAVFCKKANKSPDMYTFYSVKKTKDGLY